MFATRFGAFNGKTWEELCQKVFKLKFFSDGYQQMPASPGDYGIEGYTLNTGHAFQCYCPENHYGPTELYEKQRDKITEDLSKLKKNESELKSRFGDVKISAWIFVTPEVNRNLLLKHARTKEKEVRSWNLSILTDNFRVWLHDGDHYLIEINEINSTEGRALILDEGIPTLTDLDSISNLDKYESNIIRKSAIRLAENKNSSTYDTKLRSLIKNTRDDFLSAEQFLRTIERQSPSVYMNLIRYINEYERHVDSTSSTWSDTAQQLTTMLNDNFTKSIAEEFSPSLSRTHAMTVARHMIARWIAVCELNYD